MTLVKQATLEQGEDFFNQGKLDEAEKCFLAVLAEDRENDTAFNNLGVIAFQKNELGMAASHFRTAIRLNPLSKDALLNLVAVLDRNNDLISAIPWLRDYARRCPSDQEIAGVLRRIEKSEAGNPTPWQALWQRIRVEDVLKEPSHLEIADHVDRQLGLSGRSFLEVGSGTGGTGMAIAKHGAHVTLMDLSPEALELSRKVLESQGLTGRFVQGDMDALPFPDRAFDVVASFGVLEHFSEENIVRALMEMRRVCKGAVVTTVPNASCLFYRLGKWYAEKTGSWQYGYEKPEYSMKPYFRKAGLQIYTEYPIGFSDSLAFLSRIPETAYLRKTASAFHQENPDVLQGSLVLSFGAEAGQDPASGSKPLVSVLMCAWNAEKYIAQSIRSIIRQTYRNWELIVVDDGSTDGTAEIVRQFQDPRIRYFPKPHTGLAGSRNFAQDASSGEYTIIIDADDLVSPDLIEREVLALENTGKEPAVVYSDIELMSAEGERTGLVWRYGDYRPSEIIPLLFKAGKNIVPEASMMIPRKLLQEVGKYNPGLRDSDNEFIARLARYAKRFVCLHQPLYYYRRYEGSLSSGRTSDRVHSSLAMLESMTGIFNGAELFPSVDWSHTSPESRESIFHGKIAEAYWNHARSYMSKGCHAPFLTKAAEHLEKALVAFPANLQAKALAKEICSTVSREGEATASPGRRNPKREATAFPAESAGPGSRLRILYFADTRSPHTKRYVTFFKERGHEVHVFDTFAQKDGLDGVVVHTPGAREGVRDRTDEASRLIGRILGAHEAIEKVKPHIVHGHYVTGWGWLAILSGFSPAALTVWGSDVFLDTANVINKRLAQFCLGQASFVTADSEDLFRAAASLRGTPEGVYHIPFGIDTEFFAPGKDTRALSRKLGIKASKVVLSPRQFKPEANIDTLIRAIPEVLKKVPDTQFILKTYLTKGGTLEDYARHLRNLVRELGVEEQVLFVEELGLEDMPALYNLADVMVTLRDTDGSACSMLEAMACQVPVVASDIPSMGEWIRNGENGFLVNQRDPGEVARAITGILLGEGAAKGFAMTNYSLVREKGDYRRAWAEVERLYADALQDRAAKAKKTASRDGRWSQISEQVQEAVEDVGKGRADASKRFLGQVVEGRGLPMNLLLRAFVGLGKIFWLERRADQAEACYRHALALVSMFDLHDVLAPRSTGGGYELAQ